jgi:IclR family KDG regulon transcriptional repressor
VSAPILGPNGDVIAAISVAGAMVRFDEERRQAYIQAILDAAGEITSKLSVGRTEAGEATATMASIA